MTLPSLRRRDVVIGSGVVSTARACRADSSGHWRPVRPGDDIRVETRIGRSINRAQRPALDDAIDSYRVYSEG